MRRSLPALLAACVLIPPGAVRAQDAPCDPELRAASADQYGYRLRGDRCEGVYAREVALATLLVASFTTSFESLDPAAGTVESAWSAPGPGPVQLRAHSLRRRLYYRMDAIVDAAAQRWTWPMDLLSALQLAAAEVGLTAWVDGSAADVRFPVYLPLRVGRPEAAESLAGT